MNQIERVLNYLFTQETYHYHDDLFLWYHRGYLALIRIVKRGKM